MPESNENKPKIIIDSDWKEEARKEKEEADRQVREEAGLGELPAPSLAELVQMIVIQASVALGGVQDPRTGQPIPPQLPLAKHYIDLLEVLLQKTAGQATEDEAKLMEGTLHELRMAFVQMAGIGAAPESSEEPAGEDKPAD